MNMISRHLLVILLFVVAGLTQLNAQDAAIRGFVYEELTGEPAMLANVYLTGTTYGASTDENGYFLISRIEPGSYALIVTYLGYDTISMSIELT